MEQKFRRTAGSPLKPWEILSRGQLEQVHRVTLRILSEIGVRVDEPQALELLKAAGVSADSNGVVRIPEALVDRALQSVPHETQMYDRDGNPAFVLRDDLQVFGGGSDTISTYTREGEHIDVSLDTVRSFARLQDALPSYNFVMSMGSGIEVPDLLRDGVNFLTMLENTTKPICFTAQSMGAMQDIVSLCEAVRGSREALIEKPFTMLYAMPDAL